MNVTCLLRLQVFDLLSLVRVGSGVSLETPVLRGELWVVTGHGSCIPPCIRLPADTFLADLLSGAGSGQRHHWGDLGGASSF